MADQKFDGYSKDDLTKKLVDGETGGVTFDNLKPVTDYDFVATYAGQDPTKAGTDLGKVTTANPPKIAVTGVKFGEDSSNIDVGETKDLVATVSPDNATNKALKYSTSDATIAIIDADSGSTKGIKAGSVTITATSVDDASKKATVTLNVQKPTVNVTGITADKSLTVQVGKTAKINAVIAPDNATNKGVIYKSADPTLATVDADGTVHGVKATDPGKTVQITSTSYADGSKIATTAVTVTAA
ncbi:Ig-like domain-containing protein [Lentilactobacillus kisonensis]|uniref:BIG2 domain-containing protein n=1 Tax=Lentilactobacillus kisonensis DSM 19906 = JCM 15041 TaxID=1423766 RepID=A0A0R1NUU2_9LACO|nr:Ig-like domain-containing protein [Lentilactobacillus kisonensis]KRL20120.1 hypothetical protein FC98_GL001874 [Lentilactobacillus kisonensis DSM 19906 = JCM 15041]